MSLILNNSRDINNKFLFGHWMMRNKYGSFSFEGPGYGRINFWQCTMEGVEEDMKEMKKLGLKVYCIEMTGKLESGDGCWECCAGDAGTHPNDDGTITWNPSTYFKENWYEEVKVKYQQLISLCKKYNLWLLNLVFNDNYWQNTQEGGRWSNWVHEYPESTGERREELKLAIKELLPFSGENKTITLDGVKKLITDVVIPVGGKENVVICPVNEPETEDGHTLEQWSLPLLKSAGFTTCVYSESGDKRDAKMYQGGHKSHISEVKCKKGIGVSDNGTLLCELYYEDPTDKIWEKIEGNQHAIPSRVKELISNYKKSGAIGAVLYAIHYGKRKYNSPDVEALKAVKAGWYG